MNLEQFGGVNAGYVLELYERYRQNPDSVEAYLNSPAPEFTEAHLGEERFFVGLRLTRGIRPEPEEWRRYRQAIERFLDAGLLETDGTSLRLTGRGVLLSNEVFQEFLTT